MLRHATLPPTFRVFGIAFAIWFCAVAVCEEPKFSEPLRCVVQGNGRPIEGAKVQVTFATPDPTAENIREATLHVFEETVYTTNAEGAYEIVPPDLELPNTIVLIRISHPDYLPRQLKKTTLVDLAHHTRSTHRRPQLRPAHRIKARVLLPDGTPAVGARVVAASSYRAYSWKFFDPNDYPFRFVTTTDKNGEFTASVDRQTSFRISFPAQATLLINRIDAASDSSPEFRLPDGRRLRGRVVDYDGKPIPWAIVAAKRRFVHNEFDMPLTHGVSAIANERGEYELPPLAPDMYVLSVGSRLQSEQSAVEWQRRQKGIDRVNPYEARLATSTGDPIDVIPLDFIFLEHEVEVAGADQTVNFAPQQNVPISIQFRFPHGRLEQADAYRVGVAGWYRRRRWQGRFEFVAPDGTVTLYAPPGLSQAELSIGMAQYQRSDSGPMELGRYDSLA